MTPVLPRGPARLRSMTLEGVLKARAVLLGRGAAKSPILGYNDV